MNYLESCRSANIPNTILDIVIVIHNNFIGFSDNLTQNSLSPALSLYPTSTVLLTPYYQSGTPNFSKSKDNFGVPGGGGLSPKLCIASMGHLRIQGGA